MLLSLFYTAIALVVVGYVFHVKWREQTTGASRLGFVAAILIGCAWGARDTGDGGSDALAIALGVMGGAFILVAAYAALRARRAS
jgi:hypothetical protein